MPFLCFRGVLILAISAALFPGCASVPETVKAPLPRPSASLPEVTLRGTEAVPEPSASASVQEQGWLLMTRIRNALVNEERPDDLDVERMTWFLPQEPYAWYLAGMNALRGKELPRARYYLERALELDPAHPHALLALGDISREEMDLTAADLYYERAFAAAGTPVTANRLAALRIEGGYLESAREVLRVTLSRFPEDVITRNNLAVALDRMGSPSEAIALLSGESISHPLLLRTRAALELKEGRPDTAAQDLESVYTAGSTDTRGIWILMGTADLQRGNLAAAEDKFRTAIVVDPSGHEGFLNLGLALRRQGRFSEAEKVYLEGLDKVPHPDLNLNLGILYELYRGDSAKGLEQYREYIRKGGPASARVQEWVDYLEGVVAN